MSSVLSLCIVLLVLSFAHGAFKHPGVVLQKGQIDFVRAKLAAAEEPWTRALAVAKSSSYGKITYVPKPWVNVECGSYSNPNFGCSDETRDSITSYTQALLWQYTGNTTYLKNSIAIMDAWSATVRSHNNSNAPLQSAWATEAFTKAAELVKHLGNGAWPLANVQRFATMLTTVYLPLIIKGSGANGNWELSMINGILGIAVFTDNQTLFDKGIAMWRARVPAYFYLSPPDSDLPNIPPTGRFDTRDRLLNYWHNPVLPMPNGHAQESCRDFAHTSMGVGSIGCSAETALIQGVDLFSEQKNRIRAAIEWHADWYNNANRTVPSTICRGNLSAITNPGQTFDLAYNALAIRLGMPMPNTLQLLNRIRPVKTGLTTHYETLTHGNVGWAGYATVTTAPPTTKPPTPVPTTTKPPTPAPTTTKPPTPAPTTTKPPTPAPTTTKPLTPPPTTKAPTPAPTAATSTPFKGTPTVIPGQLQLEDYDLGGEGVAYHDTDGTNVGNTYRADGIDLSATSSTPVISYTQPGEWLQYTVSIAESTLYDVSVLYATKYASCGFQLTLNGVALFTLTLPNTTSYGVYKTVVQPRVQLPAGVHKLRFIVTRGSGNYNWLWFDKYVAPFNAQVNFQPPGFAAPAGWVADVGSVFAARNGMTRVTRTQKRSTSAKVITLLCRFDLWLECEQRRLQKAQPQHRLPRGHTHSFAANQRVAQVGNCRCVHLCACVRN